MTDWVWGGQPITNEYKTTSISDDEIYRFQNELWFSVNVNTKTINKIIKLMHEALHDEKLSAYREKNNMELILHIDSCGGVVKDAFKFIDFARQLKKKNVKIKTIINGCACSAATLMALCGDERVITQNSYTMIHELSAISGGQYTQIKSYSKHLDDIHSQILNFYQDNTKLELEELAQMLQKESYFTSQEYLEKGFVTEII